MAFLNYDPDNTLSGGLYGMTPREAIRLGIALCEAVERAVGADGCHGGIWPGNITCADGQVALGPVSRSGIAEMEPDMLEYVAPEQFWVGATSPATDVYSIGLILYTALNKGIKPYFASADDGSPEARADAMQNRMKGAPLPYPSTAGRSVGDAVLKAVSFQASDRYSTPGQFRAALEALPEGAEVPAAVPVVPLTEEERQNMPNYRVDKDFEEPEKPRRSSKGWKGKGAERRSSAASNPGKPEQTAGGAANEAQPASEPIRYPDPPVKEAHGVDDDMDPELFRSGGGGGGWKRFIIPVLLVAVIVVALILLLRGSRDGEPRRAVETPPSVETETPEPSDVPGIRPPVPETAIPGFETPEPTPEETEPPAETEEPAPPAEPTFELVMADVSWTQARDLCEQRGGHLATVRTQEQLDEVIALARAQNARFVWLGAFRGDSSTWYYVTGERMDFAVWDVGEPSAVDAWDGTREDYLLLWDRTDRGDWCYNDQRNDPVTPYRNIYGGRTAFVCEYDN